MRSFNLKRKKILITAGPTWVPIDKVRVISNIASGETGIRLAQEALRRGAKPTLLLGPVGSVQLPSGICLKRFSYFNELARLVRRELTQKRYDIVIHSAAVSDYQPKKKFYKKLRSTIENFTLEFETTTKIADKIKRYDPKVVLVIFKLELNMAPAQMMRRARKTMQESGADLCVLNTFSRRFAYRAYIIDGRRTLCSVRSKEALVECLLGRDFL